MGLNMNSRLSYNDLNTTAPKVLVTSGRYSDIITSSPVITKRSKLIVAQKPTVSIVLLY